MADPIAALPLRLTFSVCSLLHTRPEDDEFKDEKIFNATIRYLYNIAESRKKEVQMIVVNNGYPDFLPHECIVAEFDSDEQHGLPKGLIDDAIN